MKRLNLFSIAAIMILVSGLIASSASASTITIRARGTSGAEKLRLTVNGNIITTWTVTTSFADYTASTSQVGDCLVKYATTGDTSNTDGKDLQVDYIIVDGATLQAEDQAVNTGVWSGVCGGSYSEWLNCTGYIDFGNIGKTLSVSTTSLTVAAPEGSTGSFNITSNTDWTVSSDQTWLTPSPTSGSNNGTVTVTAQINMSISPRTATVTVSGTGVSSKTVTVTQSPMLAVAPTSLSLGAAENSSSTFGISSGTSWTVASDQNWLAVDPNSGSNNATVTVTAQQNNTGVARTATVTVSATGVTPLTVTVGQSGSVDSSYEIGTWSGFTAGAISWTFDDDLAHQLSCAVPMFNGYGFKLTLFTVTSPTWFAPANWPGLQAAAAVGHEIGSHTVDHTDLKTPPMSDPCQIWEYSVSQATINSYIDGNQCLTIAYPYCNEGKESLIDDYYIAGRGSCDGQLTPATPSNFYQISNFILGNMGTNTSDGINTICNNAASQGKWAVFLIHAIDDGNGPESGGYSPIASTTINQSLQYLDAHRSTIWVNTFLNVVKYIKERDDASVSERSNTGDIITVLVTDTLDNTIYNYPITIRRPLPTGWTGAVVKQNGSVVNSSIVTVGSTQYVMFDVVPDGGIVMLTRAYGDFDANGIVNLNDLDSFFDVWLDMDCGATAGIDLDGDCTVNFYEFAVFANNWLTGS